MEYMLVFKETDADFARGADPATADAYWGAWKAYVGAMMASGIVSSGNGLHPPHTATQVRVRNGQRQVQDGPYPDTREHLGGYFVIRTDSLDEALEWAARAPCSATGSTEVRPVLEMPPEMEAG